MKLVITRIPINQTRSGILNEMESGETDSSMICIMDMTKNGYEKNTFNIKSPFTNLRMFPMGRLLTIKSWIFELKDKNGQTGKPSFRTATKRNVNFSNVRN